MGFGALLLQLRRGICLPTTCKNQDVACDVEDTQCFLQASVQIVHDTSTAEEEFENDEDQGNEQTLKRKKRHKVDASAEQAEVPIVHHKAKEKVQQARQARHEEYEEEKKKKQEAEAKRKEAVAQGINPDTKQLRKGAARERKEKYEAKQKAKEEKEEEKIKAKEEKQENKSKAVNEDEHEEHDEERKVPIMQNESRIKKGGAKKRKLAWE